MARVDAELVRRGLARSRGEAVGFVAAGRVHLNGKLVPKPAHGVGHNDELSLTPDERDLGYASRAVVKLAGALDALNATGCGGPDAAGKYCLDVGASTGGFTDVLLRRGARHVLAVDVGHDQMRAELRADPRVSVRDGVNARDLSPADLPEPPGLVVADLSFISLATVAPAIAACATPGTPLLLLAKPQFEVGRERLGRGGVVRDRTAQRDVLVNLGRTCAQVGLVPLAVVPSPLPGPAGNREFFWYLQRANFPGAAHPRPMDAVAAVDTLTSVEAAAAAAVAWNPDDGLPPVCWVEHPTVSPAKNCDGGQ